MQTGTQTADVRVRDEVTLKGTTICPGIGIGTAHAPGREVAVARRAIGAENVAREHARYARAVQNVADRLREHVRDVHGAPLHDAELILKAHEIILADEELHRRVRERISAGLANAEWAVVEEAKQIIGQFEATRDAYFCSRSEDVRDLVSNILAALSKPAGAHSTAALGLDGAEVLISAHLFPSHAMLAQRYGAAGFATESKALSAHAAILLKGFEVPAVGDVSGLTGAVEDGDHVVVDGMNGLVILRPQLATLKRYAAIKHELEGAVEPGPPVECRTADHVRVRLMANIENSHQVRLALQKGLEGVGLFRTEFLVLMSDRCPDEDEQYDVYRRVIAAAADRPVVVRTFDIGADKQSPSLHRGPGQNPALGVRGIRRHLLRDPMELRSQMRAILRAAVGGEVGILLPMVTTVDDVKEAKEHLERAKKELRSRGAPFSDGVKLGAMIEIPAAAIAVKDILGEADFVSIGTNDLLQYFVAADRDNEDVVQYNDAASSAFQWLLEHIIAQAAALGREDDVTVCGEIASRPDLVRRLICLGYRSLSISPVTAETVRAAVAETACAQPFQTERR